MQQVGPLQVWGITTNPLSQNSLKSPRNASYGVARELDEKPRINRISVENNSPSALFIPEGWFLNSEYLLQSRVLVDDIFIEPFETQFASVACVESNRWGPSASPIRQEGRVPPSVIATMRSVDATRGDSESLRFRQERTWNRITTLSSKGATSRTNSLIEIMQGLSENAYREYRCPSFRDDQSGVLMALDGHPLLLEIFDNPSTLAEQIEPLVKSALLDSSGDSGKFVSDSQIQEFLNGILRMPFKGANAKLSIEHLSTSTQNLTTRVSRIAGIPSHALSINMKHPAFN